MMYDELYKVWKNELANSELEKLSSDFFSKVADYVKRLKEESRMLDKRTAKANLLQRETRNVKRMVREILQARYKKLIRKMIKGEKVPLEALTVEERGICTSFMDLIENYKDFDKVILIGRTPKDTARLKNKRIILRFKKEVPAIIGADMKVYGPFEIEDVSSLPVENAEVMIKRGLADKIEVN